MSKENASHIRGIKRFTWNLTHLMYNLFKGFGSFWTLHFKAIAHALQQFFP